MSSFVYEIMFNLVWDILCFFGFLNVFDCLYFMKMLELVGVIMKIGNILICICIKFC